MDLQCFEEAEVIFLKGVNLNRRIIDFELKLGEIAKQRYNYRCAIDHFNKAIAIDNDNEESYI